MAEWGEKKSPWAWFIGGCLTVLAVIGIVIVAAGYFGYRWAHNLGETMKNPEQRAAKAKEILGCERFPDGYYAMAGLSVPLLADVAVLTDRAPEPDGKIKGLGAHGLAYVNAIRFGKQDDLVAYFEGRTNDPQVLRRNHINIENTEVIKRGIVEGTPRLMYLVQRGTLHYNQNRTEGLMTVFLPVCKSADRTRIGVWFGPDPKPGSPLDDAALAGTQGDPAKLSEFLGHFKLCPD